MITFRPNIPYAEVEKRDKIQDEILESLVKDIDPHVKDWETQVNWENAEKLILKKLKPITEEVRGITPHKQ